MSDGRERSTPTAPRHCCPEHSGLVERIRDLEGRARAAAGERGEMRKEIVDLKVAHARVTAIAAIGIVIVNALVMLGIRALGG